MSVLVVNKKAYFEYKVLESFQTGLSLSGYMVKQVRANKVVINGMFVVYQKGQLQIIGFGNEQSRENVPLLLNKREVDEIAGQIRIKGVSCIILNIKTVGRWLKAEIAVVKGKKLHDKKEDIKKRDIDREIGREFKGGDKDKKVPFNNDESYINF
ncbi:MAG: SsrA-binding protein [candidate division SR1 bacterium]|nr:SsrA-binding protein [candidate division SR1 bacterium]